MSIYDAAAAAGRSGDAYDTRAIRMATELVAAHTEEFRLEGVSIAAALRRAKVRPQPMTAELFSTRVWELQVTNGDSPTHLYLRPNGVWFGERGRPLKLELHHTTWTALRWFDDEGKLAPDYWFETSVPYLYVTPRGLEIARAPLREVLAAAVAALVRTGS